MPATADAATPSYSSSGAASPRPVTPSDPVISRRNNSRSNSSPNAVVTGSRKRTVLRVTLTASDISGKKDACREQRAERELQLSGVRERRVQRRPVGVRSDRADELRGQGQSKPAERNPCFERAGHPRHECGGERAVDHDRI